ncbi:hypothetical protein C8J37_12912 [Rhizobium sp. PP-WC-1G-195]|nr:hypothetical protein C8J37_12912 [Rhizobium sp. PP-WC-1G-195]
MSEITQDTVLRADQLHAHTESSPPARSAPTRSERWK